MTTPAEITIYDEIEARAGNINQTGGYHTTVQDIERSRLKPFIEGDWPKFSFWPVRAPQEDTDYGDEQHTMTIILGYFDKTSDEPFADLAARLKADVVTAMHRQTTYDALTGQGPNVAHNADYDLGGLVQAFTVISTEFVLNEGQAPYCGVLVECDVKYRSPMGDPFTIDNGA